MAVPSTNKLFEIIKATTMVLGDFPPQPVDVVFLFSKSFEDTPALIQLSADIISNRISKRILLANQNGEKWKQAVKYEANPGKEYYIHELAKRGISKEKIILCSNPNKVHVGFNTREESDAFLMKSFKSGYKTAVLVTQPHQMLRAVLGTLKTIIDKKYNINLWCAVPNHVDWFKKAGGSQGLEVKPRIDHILDEAKRIIKYQEKGDLSSFTEFFKYYSKKQVAFNMDRQI